MDDQDRTDEHAEERTEEGTGEGTEGSGDSDASAAFHERPDDEEIAAIEEERERRLAPESRPENAEIDNSDAELPTVEEFAQADADGEAEGSAGSSDPGEAFREIEVSEEEQREIEEERERRLAPENRPENAEVDNT